MTVVDSSAPRGPVRAWAAGAEIERGLRRRRARTGTSETEQGDLKMQMVKRFLLGTAAGFVAVAADMPVKARPVQYVKICTLYGDGYYYIPGSDTCIRIGGYLRLDVGWNTAGAR